MYSYGVDNVAELWPVITPALYTGAVKMTRLNFKSRVVDPNFSRAFDLIFKKASLTWM